MDSNKPDARKRLVGYVLENKWRFLTGAVLGAIFTGLEYRALTLLKPFFNLAGASGGHHALGVWADVVKITLFYMAIQIPKGLAFYFQFYAISSATNRIATTIRNDIYRHLHRMSLTYFERQRIGHLMSRMTNDVGLIQNGASSVIDFLTAPMMVIAGLVQMFIISWRLAIICVVFVPVIGWVIGKITRKMRNLTTTLQLALADVAAVFEETIAGVRIVKSFGMEGHEVRRFRDFNGRSLRAAQKAARRNAAVTPVTELFGSLAVVAIILVGGWQVVHHQLDFGSFAVFGGIGFYVSSNAKKIGRLSVTYHQTMSGVERIFEILDQEPDMPDAPDALELGQIEGLVEFRDVSFSYSTGEEVLSKLSFVIEPGKSVAIVGPSGAGKSTIANIIPRFYEVTGGAVLVDGHDVREVTTASLRRHMAIVPQETILFSGTLRDNIAYGRPDASDEEIVAAAKAANAHDFVTAFEDGYQTIIGERGARLSGGERQRISIARAILKDPRILILDEATSSLDATSERLVQQALDKLMQGRSTLVIAHRLSTITKVDEIIVLARGEIVERGDFKTLLAKDGVFARLYRSQYDVQAVAATAGASSSETALEES